MLAFFSAAVIAADPVSADKATVAKEQKYLAIVGDEFITLDEFWTSYQEARKQRFYHGNIAKEKEEALRREVAQSLIDDLLLGQEARKRGLTPDLDWIESRMQQINGRNRPHSEKAAGPDHALSALRAQLQKKSLLLQLHALVDDKIVPDMKAIRDYYDVSPEKFTTPESLRVRVILLAVDPWASMVTWQAAEQEAQRLVKQLHEGADFENLARIHSSDASAEKGGDLGMVHKGVLADEAQQLLDHMSPGEVSVPLRLLKGIAIFRLDERIAPELNAFEKVESRARELWLRENRAGAWKDFIDALRQNTRIEFDEAVLFDSRD